MRDPVGGMSPWFLYGFDYITVTDGLWLGATGRLPVS